MQIPDGVRDILEPLERAGFPYMITGSVATILYGAPRITYDVDLVLDIPAQDAGRLAALYPISEFYCPPEEVISAELGRPVNAHFNLIHHASTFKADIIKNLLAVRGEGVDLDWIRAQVEKRGLEQGWRRVNPP